ncbi:hypothetical protein O179_02450 [Chlamydia trachomatis]|nr:hypothetical protein E150_02355 [Chlamydia trachomatis E/150]ADH20919.1 hypothetical protein E11023_02340 [Chlamydia trachomatis E/11023]AGJ64815.1 hypothetical protein CTLINITIAL_03680 [Chlamydia trachomatis L2/434/Bu(i)]AGJ65757.1 hypothetical protein CTLFINAL_03690 [Chlamydia trachomatis L2/434/Bu(f)]AGR94797.1 hypothetical protein CTRC46_02350 [Chlamydia trachomatis RC-L2(s)/46]AGR98517.1 hypothetical protein CTRC3_02375 [Chlamydia trachomatis RC-L2(s)/3]AGS00385.1 hypothetical protein
MMKYAWAYVILKLWDDYGAPFLLKKEGAFF